MATADELSAGSILGGLVGPAVFTVTWAVLGASREGYAPTRDQISRLAERGAPGSRLMTAALGLYGLGLVAHASALGRRAGPVAGRMCAAAGVATVAVAALPLEPGESRPAHNVAAVAGYVLLAGIPAAAARARQAAPGALRAPVPAAALSAVALGWSVISPRRRGLSQRVGLATADLWIAAGAVRMLRAPAGASRRQLSGRPPVRVGWGSAQIGA